MNVTRSLAYLLLSSVVLIGAAQAQVTPASNDANTVVTRSGNTFNITGGTTTDVNLFHSFQTFGLNAEQIANFRANPAIQNILGRVVGGDVSVINGLIRVTGSNANLYLMNPAGIVFGANARLDVAGSFTATTATGIGFGNRWFSAIGSNDYAALVGNPNSFAFTVAQPGAIVNAGNLTVGANQNLVLLGGTIVNTGQLVAPGGQLIAAAVPGQKLVRLSQPGSLLSFELAPLPPKTARPDPGVTSSSLPNTWALPIAALPALLTGGADGNATGLTVDRTGVVTLTGSGLRVEPGDVVTQNVAAGTATVAAAHNLTLVESQLRTTGDLNLVADNTIQIRDSRTKPFNAQAGGRLYLQGNQGVDIFALNHPDSGLISGGDLVLRSAHSIRSDVHYVAGGDLTFEDLNGKAGSFFSLDDPVILAQGDVTLGDYTGSSLHILAGGSVTLGAVVINNVDTTANTINPANPNAFLASLALRNITRADGSPLYVNVTPTLDGAGNVQRLPQASNQLVIDGSASPTLDVRAGINWAALGGVPGQPFFPNPFPSGTVTTGPTLTTPASSANITIASVSIDRVFDNNNGVTRSNTVLITNQYVPNLALSGGAIQVGGQSLLLPTGDPDPKGITTAGIYLNNAPGVVVIDSRSSLATGNIIARPSSIDLQAVGNITAGDLAASAPSQTSQDSVVLVSKTGNMLVNTIDAGSNGIDVRAGGLFQAIGANNNVLSAQEFFSISVLPKAGTDLRAFLDQKGIAVDPNTPIPLNFPQQPPVSLIARPQSPVQTGKPAGSLNAPITISYGGGTRLILDQTIPVFQGLDPTNPGIPTVGRVVIRGNDTTFYVGSTIAPFLPSTSDPYLSRNNVTNTYEPVIASTNPQLGLYRNQQFTPLSIGSAGFPSSASGVAAAIVIGGGNDNAFYGSTQNLQFLPPTETVTTESGGNSGSNVTIARFNQGDEGQATQRSLNNQTQASACGNGAIASAAGVAGARGSTRASSTATATNPCSTTNDDTQILQILDSAPQR